MKKTASLLLLLFLARGSHAWQDPEHEAISHAAVDSISPTSYPDVAVQFGPYLYGHSGGPFVEAVAHGSVSNWIQFSEGDFRTIFGRANAAYLQFNFSGNSDSADFLYVVTLTAANAGTEPVSPALTWRLTGILY